MLSKWGCLRSGLGEGEINISLLAMFKSLLSRDAKTVGNMSLMIEEIYEERYKFEYQQNICDI